MYMYPLSVYLFLSFSFDSVLIVVYVNLYIVRTLRIYQLKET